MKNLKAANCKSFFKRYAFFGLNKGEDPALCTVKKLRSRLLYSLSPSDYNVS